MKNKIEKLSFILGMTAAFGECVACEAKYLAFSPPMTKAQADSLREDMASLAKEMELKLHFEKNQDLAEDIVWWVIYKFDSQLDSYLSARASGFNPWNSMEEFRSMLSYGTVYGEGAENVIPKLCVPASPMSAVSKILEL